MLLSYSCAARLLHLEENYDLAGKLLEEFVVNFGVVLLGLLEDGQLYSLPVTMNMSDEDLKRIVFEPDEVLAGILDFPCHTQSVERGIKLVTEAEKSVFGAKNQDATIKVKQKSRSK
jgi:hypothetical protein